MPFPQAPAGTRWILGDQTSFGVVGGHVGDVLDVWPNEVVQQVQVGGGGGASERRVQSRSTPSEPKPRSLWTCGPAPSPAATHRVCHQPPDCTRGSPHSSAHPGTLWCWLSSRLRRFEVAWCGPYLKPHQSGNADLHFEGAGNGPIDIT